MAPRRSHVKSRSGCVTCKGRRVKCDESGPPCTRCVARGIVCAYKNGAHHAASQKDTGTALDSASPRDLQVPTPPMSKIKPTTILSERSTENLTPRTKTQMREMELLHHFTTSTHQSLGEVFNVTDGTWQVFVVQEAFKHDFLMDGILSIAGLHMVAIKGEVSNFNLVSAAEYLESGLETYRTLLYRTSPEHLHAVFAFGIVVCVNNLVHLRSPTAGRAWNRLLDKLKNLFECLNSVCRLVAAREEQLLAGPFRSLLIHLRPRQVICSDPGVKAALLSLKELNRLSSSCSPSSTMLHQYQFYEQIIDGLEACWVHEAFVLDWLVDAGKSFQVDLQKGDAFATLLLSFWGVTLHRLDRHWFASGTGKMIVEMATENLRTSDSQVSVSVAWVRAQVGLD